MKYIKNVVVHAAACLIALFIPSCNSGGSSGSGGGPVQAGAPTDIAGAILAINPVIEFLDNTSFIYDNNSGDGFWPAGAFSGNYGSETDSATNETTITLNAFGVSPITLVLSNFSDGDGDGRIDDFSYTATSDALGSESGNGSFVAGKPANPDVEESEVADLSGSPTEAEWNQYIVGNTFLAQLQFDYRYTFTDASTVIVAYDDGFDVEESVTATYTYEKISASQGILVITESGFDEDGPNNGPYTYIETLNITFGDFFSGSVTGFSEFTYIDFQGMEQNFIDSISGRFVGIGSATSF